MLLAEKKESVSIVVFEGMSDSIINQLQKFKNINFVKADISDDFEEGVENSSKVILTAKSDKQILSYTKSKTIIRQNE